MNNFMDFTLNPETYPEEKLRPYVDRLHRNHQKFIMILDPSKTIAQSN
jgi:alpha-glucosidase (family GH31 glycosyl hydrolase)